ncbi:MAG: class I SAM-dependent methyltransferase [Alphaproteobacteria bacterium]|nr:class I SAM-dependent methyltransferase [Alphaproteobacteria bacterium]
MGQDVYEKFLAAKAKAGTTPVLHCPNVSLFRFLGHLGVPLAGQRVLEVGFGGNHGADLIEAQRRGADAYGVDLVASLVTGVPDLDPAKVAVCKAGVDPLPFGGGFDLIFSRDTVYYMTDDELRFFFADCFAALREGGALVFQFIEGDLESDAHPVEEDFTLNSLEGFHLSQIYEPGNPVRFLKPRDMIAQCAKTGFQHNGSKRLIQSYGTTGDKYRVDKYLSFAKP